MRLRGVALGLTLGVTLGLLAAAVAPQVARAEQGRAAKLRLASKAFTESVVLAEIAAALARSAGVTVEHRVGLGGSRAVWDALVAGAIDAYPEYTGTLRDEILSGSAVAASPSALARALAAHGIGMTAPLGFN